MSPMTFVLFVVVVAPPGDTTGSCGDPGVPSQSTREQTDFRIRSKVFFSCSEGYDLIGSPERMCFPNGTWSGTQPFCKRKSRNFRNLESSTFPDVQISNIHHLHTHTWVVKARQKGGSRGYAEYCPG